MCPTFISEGVATQVTAFSVVALCLQSTQPVASCLQTLADMPCARPFCFQKHFHIVDCNCFVFVIAFVVSAHYSCTFAADSYFIQAR